MSFSKRLKSFFRLLWTAIKGSEQDYTSLNLNRAIFLLSVPMILEMSMESIFALVDIFFVSRLNDVDALSTIGLTESVLALIYSAAMGLSMGATAMVARRVGEKDIPGARVAGMQAIYIGIGFSMVVSVVGLFFSDDILRLMGGSETLIQRNVSYTQWMLGGNITIVLLFLINGVFRGAGDASIAMKSLILSNGLNILLAPICVLGLGPIPGLGIKGAAIATTVSRGCGVLFQLYHLLNGKSVMKLDRANIALRLDIIARLLNVSVGSIGQFLIGATSWMFLSRLVNTFGSATFAGYTLAMRVIVFAILPAWGMANAAATLVGQNLGAGRPDRAEQSAWRAAFLNMIFLGIVTIVFFILADNILGFFTTDAEVLRSGILCLKVVSLGYIFYAYGMVINQSFNGAGDTRTPIIINLIGFWAFQIPFAYVMANVLHTGPIGVYSAISIAESAIAVAAILVFRRGRWKSVKI
ncbi:MATE family efflux transporter [Parachryseolinea silvisoli]|uniref:MATE family efflux transporter n=1 Tax=Parachryseolinea silvisoli TaxID=2873601 RepID=UPI002265B258|nr:MATE family efflux transporter [Parachryseolinea silvisoli]MCD9015650.1 MATE family efflux transporter [Parachryseolinea silvisoli]